MKICLVSPLPPPLGGIVHWTKLVTNWIANEPNISISLVDTSPRWRNSDDLKIWKRLVGGGMQLLRDFLYFLLAIRGADVIHLTTSGSIAVIRDLVIVITGRILKIPVAYHLHFGRIPEIAKANTIEWRILKCVLKLANKVILLDKPTENTVNMFLPQSKVEIIPNPIDLTYLPTQSLRIKGNKILLFLGWVVASKGVEDLLAAWHDLDISENGWELVFAGPVNPSYKEDLITRFSTNGIRFIGEVSHDEALQMIADCDLFVLPSHSEAFPFVILEAMALGKAIVSTNVGAIPEMLTGECGLLVNPKDVKGLGAALRRFLVDDALCFAYGSRARERVIITYSSKVVFDKLRSLWMNLRTTS